MPGSTDSTAYPYRADELPLFPGSPYSPRHAARRRAAYALVGLLLGICSTLGNGLVSTNLAALGGALGLTVSEAAWLTAVYVACNMTANLTLIKARTQFGIPQVTSVVLLLYAGACVLQWLTGQADMATALLVRACSGLAAAGMMTLAIYYLMQAVPSRARPAALAFGIVLPQFGAPLARLFSVEWLVHTPWHGLALTELAIALTALLAILMLPLPPSERSKAFEAADLACIALSLSAALMLCGVLVQGRILWWTDAPWLGWTLAGALLLSAAVLLLERRRTRPLLQIAWLRSRDMLRFAGVALLVRVSLAEQSFGAVGWLAGSGLNNDQLQTLFALVALATLAGAVVALFSMTEPRLPYQVMAAALLIAVGAWLDTETGALTGPEQLYLSQALIGFGNALFLGPALVYGFSRMLQRGADFLVSFVVLFSCSQNLGALIGSALLGSVQTIAERAHSQALMARLTIGDAQAGAALKAGMPVAAQLNREASLLAYNDVFSLVAWLALLTAAYVAVSIVKQRRSKHE